MGISNGFADKNLFLSMRGPHARHEHFYDSAEISFLSHQHDISISSSMKRSFYPRRFIQRLRSQVADGATYVLVCKRTAVAHATTAASNYDETDVNDTQSAGTTRIYSSSINLAFPLPFLFGSNVLFQLLRNELLISAH